jgi:predicted ATPase
LKSRLPAKPVLVGRDPEIKLLRQHLDSALNGKGSTVLICEAGLGKTRLVNEFLNLAKRARFKMRANAYLFVI